ncbi:hypothetical protein MLD38_005583 [Melastoma candidum]|uniref:Uncharacterized protein n=1 Tax=Melastoma candidum TaxID=119954 RepID=A0ACB9RPA9_9MYRT|nr:hypothetical protein MLD38_005583 [Melastoma candidum]
MRHIHHWNLVKVITTCSSIDHAGNEFKALEFKYMPNGSLEKWLRPCLHQPRMLNWNQRLDRVTDVANAIHYMHRLYHTPIVPCNLKLSNDLLDEDFCARVSDFGLVKILSPLEVISASLEIRGTIGCVAPEYSQGSKPSIRGNVYSYRILLLETFTDKRPTYGAFTDSNSIQSYVKQALTDQVEQIADLILVLASDNSHSHSSLISVLQIGLAFSTESPGERPDMGGVFWELHAMQ